MKQYLFMLKEVGAHNGQLNSSLRMSFGWLMDSHKMTLFKKNPKELERNR